MNELTINLNNKSKQPLYEQIYSYIKEDIQKGNMAAHEKLPSSRALSAHLQVSRSTVDLAYEQLLSEGYLESVPCKGYYVCQIEELYHLSKLKEPKTKETAVPSENYDYDFTPNGIDLDSFPYAAWRKITKNTLIDDNKELFQLGESKGEQELRETICSYLHQARGVNCSPGQVVVGAGNDYLLLLLSGILGTQHKVAMENPTYKHAYRIFEQMNFEVCTVDVDAQGMNVQSLDRSGADIAYVMPSHQYPLGIVMPIRRRIELLKWAADKPERYIIEDDYDSEFRYKGKPIPALQGTDLKGRVIYIGTFSKSIAPAIRISYMVLPQDLVGKYEEAIRAFSSTVSRIDQTILNSFIKEGYYERHLNKMRGIYSKKHDALLNEMKSMSNLCRVKGEHAGVHILVEFPSGMSEEEIIQKAKKAKVKVYPLSEYYVDREEKKGIPTIIMGYATLSEQEIGKAVERLKEAWNSLHKK